MGRNVYGELGGICALARVRYEARVEERQQRKRSLSEPLLVNGLGQLSHAKLHKPPTQQKLYERPRNRLQKRATAPASRQHQSSVRLFILEFEPYPPGARPSEFLGVYSSIDSVTAAAFRHGACSFSKEGLLDGSEYLSPTGRIRIIPTTVVTKGTRVNVPERTQSTVGEAVRLDIPHPKEQEVGEKEAPNVYLAIHRGPHIAVCLGAFSDKNLAWGACLKEKTACGMMGTVCDEIREIGDKNMPQVSARIVGSGRHVFSVQAHAVDSKTK